MMPLIERLKDERSEMLDKLEAIRVDLLYHRERRNAATNKETRIKHSKDHAIISANFFRVQRRLGELKQEIKDENIRLTAALEQANIENRRQRRAGLINKTPGSK